MRRGRENEARKLRRDTLKKTGLHFNIVNDSTVSSVVERMKKKIAVDSKLLKRISMLESLIFKSQERI